MRGTGLAFVAMTLCLNTGTAQALSCLRPNIARTFNDLNSSERNYVMALGVLEQTGARVAKGSKPVPDPDRPEQPVRDIGIPHEVPARFTGQMYGAAGLGAEQSLDVVVVEVCLASWCGSFPKTAQNVLVFIEQTEVDYRIRSGPCEGDFKLSPSQKELDILQSCLAAGQCSDAHIADLEQLPN